MTNHPIRFTSVFALFLLLLAGCGGSTSSDGNDAFQAELISISPDHDAAAFIPFLEGELRLLHASPIGELVNLQPNQGISISFSQPIVALGTDIPTPDSLLTIEPAIDGQWRWNGTQSLIFQPDNPLPRSTEFAVSVAPGITAIDGERIDESFSWTFETPRPRVVGQSPTMNRGNVDPRQSIRLTFNQPLSASLSDAHFRIIHQQENTSLPFRFALEEDSVVVLTPNQPFTKGANIQVVASSGIPAAEGTLPSIQQFFSYFTVYSEPDLINITQRSNYYDEDFTNFNPGSGVWLNFATPVSFENLRNALTISPHVALPAGIETRDDVESASHRLPLFWEPQTRYTISVDSLVDIFGQLLVHDEYTFSTVDYKPSFSMPNGLLVLEAEEQHALPIHVTNVDMMSFDAQPLGANEIIPLLSTYDRTHHYGIPRVVNREEEEEEVMELDVETNKPAVLPFELDPYLQNGTGVVALRTNSFPSIQSDAAYEQRAFVQVTHMGITGKFSAFQNLFWVTSLSTAEPVADARVTVRGIDNEVYWEGITDEEGKVTGPGWYELGMESTNEWSAPTQFAFVEKEGDLAFTSSIYNDGMEPYRMGVWFDYDAENPVKETGLVFSDRGLYKAGETAHFKGIIRKKTDGEWMPITDSVRVLIESPREELVHDKTYLASDMGTFDFTWTSRASADLGTYVIRVTHADDEEATTRESWESGDITQDYFRVDAFRRATFAVDVHAMMPAYTSGDFYEAKISGRYLFGAEMQDQPLRYNLYRRSTRFSPPGYDGFRFGAYRRSRSYNPMLASDDTALDAAGEFDVRVSIPPEPNGQVTRLDLTAVVTDPARQESAGEQQVIVHPALFYLGLKPSTTFLDLTQNAELSVDLVAVDPNGVPVGASDVTVQLIRRQWNSVREVGSDGRLRWRSERADEVIQEQLLSLPQGQGQRLNLDVELGGSYIIQAEGRDHRGNLTRTEAYFYATGAGYVAWQRSDDDHIELQADKETYSPGETAYIMVQSPYEEAQALITVEREGIISSRIETLQGSAPKVEIPLTDAHLPNVYVSVMLLTGRSAPPSGAADIGAPGFKVGYTTLTVDPGERHLAVEIIPDQETYRPGDEVEVTLQLTDGEGNNVEGEITFSAADAGVLNLIGYTLPDPFHNFYGHRPLGVSTSQTLANLVKQRSYGQKEEDEGGGGGMDDGYGNVRKDFRPLAHWEPALRTNSSGRATIRFTLPESLTTFRLMAAALTSDNHYGNGQTDIIVTKPLVLKPALPRFARLEDRFEAGVLVTNTTGQDGTATIQVQANGLALDGASEKQVDVPNGATREVRFDWMADQTGDAELQFGASLDSERDAFVVNLPVQLPEIKETVAVFASTEATASQQLQLPASAIPNLGSFEARVASTALVGLDGAAKYLFQYPYGCLEQRTSRIRPLIAGEALLASFDLTVLSEPPATLINEWVDMLGDYWMGSGFSLWPGGRYRSSYVSAYVVLALAEAKEAGYAIPTEFTLRAVDALAEHVRQSSSRPEYYTISTWNDSRALMLYALARHDAAPLQELDAAVREAVRGQSNAFSSAGQSHLLRAVTLVGEPLKSQYQQGLIDNLIQRLRIEGTTAYLTASQDPNAGWIFASDTRATAFGLTALLEADPPAEFQQFAEQMVRYLIGQRQGGRWATTQENAAVVEALYRYTQQYEEASPDFTATVQIAGQQILQSTFQGRSLEDQAQQVALSALPQDGGPMPVTINKDGEGRAYYSLLLQSYPSGPVEAREQGLRVTRTMQLLNDSGERIGGEMATGGTTLELEAGQLVRVVIRLTSMSDRNYVVVDDALPAGLEAVNDAFITSDSQLTQDTGTGRWWGSFNYTQMKDDRVLLFADYLRSGDHSYSYVARATTPGTYVHPPAQSELMYRPEINGRNATGALIVLPPAGETADRR